MATDTDSYAFSISTINANEGMTAAPKTTKNYEKSFFTYAHGYDNHAGVCKFYGLQQ